MIKIHVEIFIASRILYQKQEIFTAQDIIDFIDHEFGDTRPGIQTHATAACVANAPANFPTAYNYLWRLDHNQYRPFQPGQDLPSSGKENGKTQPKIEDIPEKYRYLILETPHNNTPSNDQPTNPPKKQAQSNNNKETKSFRSSASFGKRQEYIAVAELLRRGHDVYMTLVDDQQIDCVIRQEKNGELRYLDIQVKARSIDAKNPALFAAMEIRSPRENFYYVFYSESAGKYWIIPSLVLVKEAHQNKEGKNKGKFSITFAIKGKEEVKGRPKFAEYEDAFDLLEWK